MLYNDACPYKTPAQAANAGVRQTIEGYPIVIFWHDTENGTTTFLGKYNANLDKSAEECFGFVEGDESWEIRNNTGDRVLWKSDDYTSTIVDEDNNVVPAWLSDFEARFPDTDPPYTDPSQLQEFATWVKSTDPTQATGDALEEAVTIVDGENSTTYTNDTAAYRKAKFRAELSDYVELDSALFYYLFTELFLMVDSRAKNMFPSFIGASLVETQEGGEESGESGEDSGNGEDSGEDSGNGDDNGSEQGSESGGESGSGGDEGSGEDNGSGEDTSGSEDTESGNEEDGNG